MRATMHVSIGKAAALVRGTGTLPTPRTSRLSMKSPLKISGLTVVMAPLWILTAVLLLAATGVRAQEARWRELTKEADALIFGGSGKVDAALAKLRESAQLAEQALGPDHPDVAVPLL